MTNERSILWLHRLALAEVGLALVTLTFGALVTSKNAGMAFADWPTSDGYLMVTYPWLQDFAKNWDKFLEHGHRLAGMVIGLWSILLVIMAARLDHRRRVFLLACSILLGVICQGLLGGFRVQLNDRGLAMLHGIFASIVFSLMGTMVAVTSRNWLNFTPPSQPVPLTGLKRMSVVLLVLVLIQYLLGSFIRHQGIGLHEHLGLGLLVLVAIAVNAGMAWRSGQRAIWKSASWLVVIAAVQVGLGLMSWILRYGLPQMGYVAVADSIQQVLVRTVHMVWGTVTLMAVVVNVLKIYRAAALPAGGATPAIQDHVAAVPAARGGQG